MLTFAYYYLRSMRLYTNPQAAVGNGTRCD